MLHGSLDIGFVESDLGYMLNILTTIQAHYETLSIFYES